MNAVNENTLAGFRQIAEDMGCNGDWQWVGAHMSQRMFGITEQRAKEYARKYGGEAKVMEVAKGTRVRKIGTVQTPGNSCTGVIIRSARDYWSGRAGYDVQWEATDLCGTCCGWVYAESVEAI